MEGHVRKRHRPNCAKRVDPKRRCNCDGSWQARYPDPARPGTTHKIERTFRTRRAAEDWLVSQRASVRDGTHIAPRSGERPFSEVVAAWRGSWGMRLSPTTRRRYEGILNWYLLPEFGRTPVAQLTPDVVQRYVDRLAASGDLAPNSVRNVYAVLRAAMTRAVRMRLLRANPCVGIELPKPRNAEMLFLTADELRAVAETIDPHYKLVVLVAGYLGLRSGEIAGLQRQDVDLLRGVVHVRRAVKDINGVLEYGDLKTDASKRRVTLPAFLRDALADHLTRPRPGGTGAADEPVFTMKNGGVLRMGLVYSRYFRRAVAGWTDARGRYHPGALPERLHKLRFHDLRHTAASLAIDAGAHPLLVSKMLGHSSVQITLDCYSHLMPDVVAALAEKLDAIYNALPPKEADVAELQATV
jgi:integrase